MKKGSWLGILPLLLLLVACGTTPATRPETAPEVAPAEVEISPATNELTEGVVVPARESSMSFLVAGTVNELNIAEGDLVQAGDTLITLATPELDSIVLANEAALDAAVADLQYWLVARKHKPPERRWLAEDRVEAAKAAIETARTMQAQQNLLAPYTATVIEINSATAQVVNPYQQVLLLADLDNLKIETTDLSERDLVNVQVGQPVLVYIEALDLEAEGILCSIATMPEEITNDVIYTATIELNETPADLRWGMSVKLDFEIE